jgi:ubiquinone/menaquinone biosynthesis C-methylase UbiE
MGFYQKRILPPVTNILMRQKALASNRARTVPGAQGRVLEIGIGSGLNLPFYTARMQEVVGLDASPQLLTMAQEIGRKVATPVRLLEGPAEVIPLETGSVDTVVTTWTMCSIPDITSALGEVRRVLKPDGCLLFVEHGRAPEAGVRWWQDRLTPLWKHVSGGCHLNRAIASLIECSGFRIDRLENSYLPGPKPLTFIYEGRAGPR